MIRRLLRRLNAAWAMDYNPAWDSPPADVPLLDLEQVEHELAEQAQRPPCERDLALVSFLLDMRGSLGAMPAGSEVLPARARGRAS